MPENETKYRLKSPDVLKGAGIIAIIFIHILTQAEPENGVAGSSSYPFIFDVTYAGLMMFFLFQGYFYKPHSNYWDNLKKRIIQLVPAFLVCGVVLTLVMAGWGNIYGCNTSIDELIHAIALTLTNNALEPLLIESTMFPLVIQGWYFIVTSLGAMIIFYAVSDIITKSWKYLVPTVAILLVLAALATYLPFHLPFNYDLVPMALSFMLIGAFMRKHNVVDFLETKWKTKKYWLILIPVATVGIVFSIFFPTTLGFTTICYGEHGPWSAFTFFVLNLCCGYFLMAICGFVCKLPHLTKFFTFFSVRVPYILLVHCFYLKLLSTPFFGMSYSYYYPYIPVQYKILFAIGSVVLSAITVFISMKVYNYLKAKVVSRSSKPKTA